MTIELGRLNSLRIGNREWYLRFGSPLGGKHWRKAVQRGYLALVSPFAQFVYLRW